MRLLRIGMAQINPTVGDIEGNKKKILEYIEKAKKLSVDLIAFPELAVTGYPPEDLLLMPHFIEKNLKALQKIAREIVSETVILGFIDRIDDIFNAAAVIHNRKVVGVYHKICLSNYGIFDEYRYFQAGMKPLVFELNGTTVGVNICEDLWLPGGPSKTQALQGNAELLVNIAATSYYIGKSRAREKMLSTRAMDNAVIIAFVNMVGGQDQLVFEGKSMILDPAGNLIASGRQFKEDLIIADLNMDSVFKERIRYPRRRREKLESNKEEDTLKVITIKSRRKRRDKHVLQNTTAEPLEQTAETYGALVLGFKDYVEKNGFIKVAVGLSGGIDSSLSAAIAVDALGKDRVVGVTMPSKYSSRGTKSDAIRLADNLRIRLIEIPIQEIFEVYLKILKPEFKGLKEDVTEENIQSRIRANILMALSNKFGWLIITAGNKSETAVGYCAIYGDSAGGFAMLKDVSKTLVYKLAKHVNSKFHDTVIPLKVISRAPSAELKPNQKDRYDLPPYSTLDPILEEYVEMDRGYEEIVADGFDEKTVRKIVKLVDKNEHKRRQAPIGIKITKKAFGKDRRLPITNKFSG